MGNQKLKWTAEEEEALLAGVEKHGPGKWKNILRDEEFAAQLANRSNIDLKDKWRNISVAPGIQGSKDKFRTPKVKAAAFTLASAAAAATSSPSPSSTSSPVATLPRSGCSDLSNDDSCATPGDAKNVPRYDGMIFEALSSLTDDDDDDDGFDVSAIFGFIEKRHEVPSNFRRMLSSRLRRLAAQGKVEKVSHFKSTQNFYKMNDNSLVKRTPPVAKPKETNVKPKETNVKPRETNVKPRETNVKPRQANSQAPSVSQEMVNEAAITAAYKLVEVENKIDMVKVASEEVDRMTKLAEDADNMLVIALEMHEKCSLGEIIFLD